MTKVINFPQQGTNQPEAEKPAKPSDLFSITLNQLRPDPSMPSVKGRPAITELDEFTSHRIARDLQKDVATKRPDVPFSEAKLRVYTPDDFSGPEL